MTDKEDLVNRLFNDGLLSIDEAALLLDNYQNQPNIADFERQTNFNNLDIVNAYIQHHINFRNTVRAECGCSECTCTMSLLQITE